MSFKILYSSLIVIILFSCKKDNQDDRIPNVTVSQTIYLNLPSYTVLNSVGNYVYISGGYRGIIVYRRSISEFVAYDRACPYDPTVSGALLEVDSNGLTTVDRHCGSKFLLVDGSVNQGPATSPMKGYATQYDGNNQVYIYN